MLVHVVLIAMSTAFMMPLVWLISTSLKTNQEAMQMPPIWIPESLSPDKFGDALDEQDSLAAEAEDAGKKDFKKRYQGPLGYVKYAFRHYYDALTTGADKLGYSPFPQYAKNTIYICILSVIGTVAANALIAYGFARIQWKGREVLFWITLATMMVPFPVTMVPTYGLFKWLGWIGSFKPLWVPAWFGSAFNIYLLREFFRTIPTELTDAARIDGCSEFGIFMRIILPLSKPALSVVALFNFLYMWNNFLGPRIYLTDQRMFTLSLGLQSFQSQHGGTQWHHLMAASAVMVVPIIVLFFFTQRTFIQGITLTGMKG